MSEFKIGEVIRLKSGGPRMTINYVMLQGKPVVLFYKVGEVIRLKSGDPRLTINYVKWQGKPVVLFYEADWFTDDGKLQHGYFSPETIEAAPDPDNTYRSDPDRGPLPASSLVQ